MNFCTNLWFLEMSTRQTRAKRAKLDEEVISAPKEPEQPPEDQEESPKEPELPPKRTFSFYYTFMLRENSSVGFCVVEYFAEFGIFALYCSPLATNQIFLWLII